MKKYPRSHTLSSLLSSLISCLLVYYIGLMVGSGRVAIFQHSLSVPLSLSRCPSHHTTQVVLQLGDLVKLDLGVHVDGYIAVAAHTFRVTATGTHMHANPHMYMLGRGGREWGDGAQPLLHSSRHIASCHPLMFCPVLPCAVLCCPALSCAAVYCTHLLALAHCLRWPGGRPAGGRRERHGTYDTPVVSSLVASQ